MFQSLLTDSLRRGNIENVEDRKYLNSGEIMLRARKLSNLPKLFLYKIETTILLNVAYAHECYVKQNVFQEFLKFLRETSQSIPDRRIRSVINKMKFIGKL